MFHFTKIKFFFLDYNKMNSLMMDLTGGSKRKHRRHSKKSKRTKRSKRSRKHRKSCKFGAFGSGRELSYGPYPFS